MLIICLNFLACDEWKKLRVTGFQSYGLVANANFLLNLFFEIKNSLILVARSSLNRSQCWILCMYVNLIITKKKCNKTRNVITDPK